MRKHPVPFAILGALVFAMTGAFGHEDEPIADGAPDRLGDVVFPISCSAAAQGQFNRALAMLHSFFYSEAVKVFGQVTQIDPSCAMGHWGVAMSRWYPIWFPPTKESFLQGKNALQKAQALAAPTERERAYIAALANFYGDFDEVDHRTRSLAYEKAMAEVHRRFPNDREAAAFYALALQSTADPNDKTYANQLQSAVILERLFAEHPNHPGVAHYLIHAYDYPELASRALAAARRYGAIAPAMPHALHMPSHIYIAVGIWQDAIESNIAAGAAARKLGWIQEELHTMDYLVYAYLQSAQTGAAQKVLESMREVTIADSAHTLVLDYALAAAPARVALERKHWEEAFALTPLPSRFPAAQALTYFARALGAVRSAATNDVEKEIAQLTRIRDELLRSKQDYWARQVDVQLHAASAWLEWAKGHGTGALELMREAVALEESTFKHPVAPGQLLPMRELMGDLLMASGLHIQALAEYEAQLHATPNRFNSVYGAARSAEKAGVIGKAVAYYRQLLDLSKAADGDHPELRHAERFLTGKCGLQLRERVLRSDKIGTAVVQAPRKQRLDSSFDLRPVAFSGMMPTGNVSSNVFEGSQMKCNSLLGVAIAAAGLISSCALAQDAVSVDPKHHKVEFENNEVRVLRISFGPGETAPMHDHPCAIAVGIQDGTLEFGFPDGTSRAASLKRGQVVTPKPTTHQVANKSNSAFEVILVELKKGGC